MLDTVLEIGKAFSVERRSLLSVRDVGFWTFPWWLPSKRHPLRGRFVWQERSLAPELSNLLGK